MAGQDQTQALAERVQAAAAARRALAIHGSGSKRFLCGVPVGEPLDLTGHRGIVSYEPTELVITARAGTPLTEIEAALAASNQMLGFEPPHFGPGATLGGTIACGLSGPRRPYAGSARDFVLGTRLINGQGEILRFGGQVMKNVAGFDLSRLVTGSRGTLGVLLDISLKVLPRPEQEITLGFEMTAQSALQRMNEWAAQPLPLSAAAHSGDTLYVRLSGTAAGIGAAHQRLGGELLEKGHVFWEELREHRRGFFQDSAPLWRLSVPAATPPLDLPGKWLLDWGGAQRWLLTEAPADRVMQAAMDCGGHAETCRPAPITRSLPAGLLRLNQAVKSAFDPHAILNGVAAR